MATMREGSHVLALCQCLLQRPEHVIIALATLLELTREGYKGVHAFTEERVAFDEGWQRRVVEVPVVEAHVAEHGQQVPPWT